MNERVELACASCDKTGTLHEEVSVESSGSRKGTPYSTGEGEIEVDYGHVDVLGPEDVIDTDGVYCSACGESFATWKEATANQVFEYRCESCGWWGRQDWLHPDECEGALERLRAVTYNPDQLVAVVSEAA